MGQLFARTLFGVLIVSLLAACDTGPKSSRGFRLPDGNAVVGQELFVKLRCNDCHTIIGLELEPPANPGPVSVALGGPVSKIKNYGGLVTSVINPSHKLIRGYPEDEVAEDGESRMRNYNEMMTVQQLIDVVAFLQLQYKLTLPEYTYN